MVLMEIVGTNTLTIDNGVTTFNFFWGEIKKQEGPRRRVFTALLFAHRSHFVTKCFAIQGRLVERNRGNTGFVVGTSQ
jgi:hypothetical protein